MYSYFIPYYNIIHIKEIKLIKTIISPFLRLPVAFYYNQSINLSMSLYINIIHNHNMIIYHTNITPIHTALPTPCALPIP